MPYAKKRPRDPLHWDEILDQIEDGTQGRDRDEDDLIFTGRTPEN